MKVTKIEQEDNMPFVTIVLTKTEANAYRDLIGFSNRNTIRDSSVYDDTKITDDQYDVLMVLYKQLNKLLTKVE